MHREWNIEHLQKLIEKYLSGRSSVEEKNELEAWYASLGEDMEPYSNDDNKETLRTDILTTVINQRSLPSQGQANQVRVLPIKTVVSQGRKRFLAAALFILLAGFGTFVYQFFIVSPRTEFATAFGKIDTLILPDKSSVVLNANSTLSYKKLWKKDQSREIWLDGEALFKIVHINQQPTVKPYERFIVHVANADIEVLGTVFNVRQRRGKTEIVLQEGRIKVFFQKINQPEISMLPGEMISIDPVKKNIIKSVTKPEEYTAWTNRKLILSDPTLKDITEYLEDNYGKKIAFSDSSLENIKIGGMLMIDNLDDALLILSKTLNLKVVEENNTLFISPK